MTVTVPAGGDFQAALDAAQPGDVIELAAGAVYTGNFRLPNPSGTSGITVRTSTPASTFPAPGVRVTPADAPLMPTLTAASGAVLWSDAGAHHIRFVGMELRPAPNTFLYHLVLLESPDGTAAGWPHDIVFERCYLHGDPVAGTRRGITLNGGATTVRDCHLADFKEVGADSQALCGWAGPGPFTILNNYLEAAGENILFGGNDPTIPDTVPSDIEIRQNHIAKSLAWKIGHPLYAGVPWTVKNLLELKNARRVLIEGNLFEHAWLHGQTGFAVLFTVRNQGNTAPWSTIEDVTFRCNLVRHTGSGVQILGLDDTYPSQRAQRITIRHNLFMDLNAAEWGGDGRLFQVANGPQDLVIEHNTGFQSGTIVTASGTPPTAGFVFRDNIAPHNAYGVIGDGQGPGNPTLDTYFPGAVFERNVLADHPDYASMYPPGNYFPPTFADIGFVDLAGGDYRLAPTSPYHAADPDGSDLGMSMTAIVGACGPQSLEEGTGPQPQPPPLPPPAPVLTVSATAVKPAMPVTATLTDSPGNAQDWLALAAVGAPPTTYLKWIYVGADVSARTWTVTMPKQFGAYEFRLFLANGYDLAATSPTVVVKKKV